MPYYVYAIHTDSLINRLCNSFDDFKEAEHLEQEIRLGRIPGDNYVVQRFYAENDIDAETKLNDIRKKRNLPTMEI